MGNVKLDELEIIINMINDNIRYYENGTYENTGYDIFLSNGDRIRLLYPKEVIPHLLGVNIPYLISKGLYKNKNFFDILKEVCSNPYQLYQKITNGIISYNDLFSKYVNEKNKIFKSNLSNTVHSISYICKYDSTKTFSSSENKYSSNYFIIREQEDGDIIILGIVREESGNYKPRSSIYIQNPALDSEQLYHILHNQEICILTGINSLNYNGQLKKHFSYVPLRIERMEGLERYCNKYDCIASVKRDYLTILKLSNRSYNNNEVLQDYIKRIAQIMREGRAITEQEIDSLTDCLSESMLELINSYNDLVTDSFDTDFSSYSKLQSENKVLNQEVLRLKNEIDEANNLILELREKSQELESQNIRYEEAKEKIQTILMTT